MLTAESNLTELSFCGQVCQPTLPTAGKAGKSCGGVEELLLEQQVRHGMLKDAADSRVSASSWWRRSISADNPVP